MLNDNYSNVRQLDRIGVHERSLRMYAQEYIVRAARIIMIPDHLQTG